MWPNKSTARDLGAFICFEDEAGQGLRPPKGRTWAPRGARPIVKVRGAGGGRVGVAGVACCRPGTGRTCSTSCWSTAAARARPKGFAWAGYRDLIIAAHRQLAAPLVWVLGQPQHPPGAGAGGVRRGERRPGYGCTGCPRTRRT